MSAPFSLPSFVVSSDGWPDVGIGPREAVNCKSRFKLVEILCFLEREQRFPHCLQDGKGIVVPKDLSILTLSLSFYFIDTFSS